MIDIPPLRPFQPNPPDAAGIISWIHLGDLHMTVAGEENHLNLLRIVDEVNAAFAGSLAFAFLPGDVADQGSAAQYEVVRQALDQLTLPWCAIVGDHDVHEKSFSNFLQFMAEQTHSTFSVGNVRFFRLNAFDIPDPGSFTMLSSQLEWLEQQLQSLKQGETAVLLLHCYPTDLKQGGGELHSLLNTYPVRLIDMGHTHYNEVANDGHLLYTATRSTGQIEEGPAGYSITNLDGPVTSWKFFPLDSLPAVMITSPAEERFIPGQNAGDLVIRGGFRIRAKAWSSAEVSAVHATLLDQHLDLRRIAGSNVWEGEVAAGVLPDGVHSLTVELTDAAGKRATDQIKIVVGESAFHPPHRAERDQDNAVSAWPERGLLGTQLGPNKNGRKW